MKINYSFIIIITSPKYFNIDNKKCSLSKNSAY